MEQIGLQPQLLVMQAVAFVILYLILKRFLFGPIGNMMQARNEEIAERLNNAERDERAMEAVRTEYERRIAGIETEARDRIQEAMTEARRIADEIKEEAHKEAEGIRDRSLAQIEREKEKALKQIQDHIVDLSIDAASRVVSESLDDEDHRRLVRGFIDELESETSS
jgi:F-type H+-transporting ATPase subunit b